MAAVLGRALSGFTDVRVATAFADGSFCVEFIDGVSITLAPGAAVFTVDPQGERRTHLTKYAVSEHRERVYTCLNLRNVLSDHPRVLKDMPFHKLRLNKTPVTACQWSKATTVLTEDGWAALSSDDSLVTLLVPPQGHILYVTFPLALPFLAQGDKTPHVTARQVFAAALCPPRWRQPFALALAALKGSSPTETLGHGPTAHSAFPECLEPPTKGAALHAADQPCLSDAALLRYHREGFLFWRLDEGVGGVVIIDGSSIHLDCSGYIQHTPCEGETTHFLVETAPRLPVEGETKYSRHLLANFAAAFHLDATQPPLHRSETPEIDDLVGTAMSGYGRYSAEVVHSSSSPRIGTLTAYRDGRITANFVDRTLLELSPPPHDIASAVLPDGSRLNVLTTRPIGLERHVSAALEFARTAFLSPVQRKALDQQRRHAKDEAQRELQKIRFALRDEAAAVCRSFPTPPPSNPTPLNMPPAKAEGNCGSCVTLRRRRLAYNRREKLRNLLLAQAAASEPAIG